MRRHTETRILASRAPKPLRWLGTTLADLRAFPAAARQVAGFQLWRVQLGLVPDDWRPMPGVGATVQEIRIHTGQEHRVIYTARYSESVYVLHAFQKQSRKTPRKDVEKARQRLELMLRQRREELGS